MKERSIEFYSEGIKLVGSLWLPDDYQEGAKLPCIIPCSGIQGIKAIYPELYARFLTKHGYAILGFDYRGWAPSEGTVGDTTMEGEYQDIQAAYIFATQQPEIDANNIGLFGWGFAAPIVIMLGVHYPEIKAVACGNGFYNGKRLLQTSPLYSSYLAVREEARADLIKRVLTGKGDYVMPYRMIDNVLVPERRSAFQEMTLAKVNPDIGEVLERDYGGKQNFPPLQSWTCHDSMYRMNVEPYVAQLAPRGLFLCGSTKDVAYPYTETEEVFKAAGEGRVLYPVDGAHNDWMFDDDPRFLGFVDAMAAFFDSYLK